ncbi:MAG: ABC transporter ATP-binding protein [Acidimicrobiales bacterium]|nr:ABC transporter ATP-binding protein [Acidimicrobiales bacterium]
MIDVSALEVSYGPVTAVRGIDLTVGSGEVVVVLGRNGAGKTTTLKAMAGLLPSSSGSIWLDGEDVTSLPAERRVERGLVLVPEGRGMFAELSVRENLIMGAYHRRLPRSRLAPDIDRVTARFPRLTERLEQPAGSLSGGEQQMLAIARGLMAEPRVLMVDEPSLGLAPIVIELLYELLADLARSGLTLVIVEQYVQVALGVADRAYVLDKGVVALSGTAAELAASPDLVDAYLSSAPQEAPA